MADKRRIAFVPPRYGPDVVGGAESVLREAAHGLAERGWEVDVLTTCATDHYTWANAHSPGVSTDEKVKIHRFPTVHDGDRLRRDTTEIRIQQGARISPGDQEAWLHGNFRVPELFHYLLGAATTYDAIILSPYLVWTTIVCSIVAPERTIVMPCLHDEFYAYLDIFRPVLGDVGQVWFLSEPEHTLAHRLGPVASHHVIGAGVAVPTAYDPDGFRARHGIKRPFVFYAGRREGGKGWDELLGSFRWAVADLGVDLDLVTTGVGPVNPPPEIADRVIDLGFLAEQELPDAFAAAAAYVQPSRNESFSRVIMEAWLAGTPVLASAGSDVVRWHCERSGAGLVYEDGHELVQCLALVASEPQALKTLASAGREYVLTEYRWEAVLDRMEAALSELPK